MLPGNCVTCGQTLPPMSRLSELVVPATEAAEKAWANKPGTDGAATVKMCLQCQINRAEDSKRPLQK